MFADDTRFFSLHSNEKYLLKIANKKIKNEWMSMNKYSLNACSQCHTALIFNKIPKKIGLIFKATLIL